MMILSRLANVRELRAGLDRLKRENAALRDELSSLKAHFSTALVAVEDMRSLPAGGKMIVVDGWNRILGANRQARSRGELVEKWRAHLASRPQDFVWIVFDGPVENVTVDGRLRVSYTGGSGPHRADRLICDYLRAVGYLGLQGEVVVDSDDRDLLAEARRLVAVASTRQSSDNNA